MHSNAPHLPDVFEVARLGYGENGHNPATVQMNTEPIQMVLVSIAETDGQMSLPLGEEEEVSPDEPAPAGP